MKTCPRCKSDHQGTGVYCSRKCANSRTFTEAARRKKSKANKKYWAALSTETREEKVHASLLAGDLHYINRLMSQDWEVIGIQGKRKRVILEQKGKCNRCGISEWNNEPITLEYEHKDGNKSNNARKNVECLCPNCHSQTKTWRGRKNKGRQKRVEKLLQLV